MNSILKKTQRKDRRIAISATCFILPQNSTRKVPVELMDISLSGMGFYCAQAAFQKDSFVEIYIPVQRRQHLIIKAKIVISPQNEEVKKQRYFRYSVRFESRLTDSQINTLLSCLDFTVPVSKSA